MNKILNIFFFIMVLIFFFSTFKYYSSNNNIKVKDYNRKNIEEIINTKISNLPVLNNNTDDVIEFNDGFSNEKNNKPRSFWKLLRSK